MVDIGDVVTFIDSTRKEHNALVTAVWDGYHGKEKNPRQPSLNLVVVLDDENMEDPYGRQIRRETSVVHISNQSAKAYCWVVK